MTDRNRSPGRARAPLAACTLGLLAFAGSPAPASAQPAPGASASAPPGAPPRPAPPAGASAGSGLSPYAPAPAAPGPAPDASPAAAPPLSPSALPAAPAPAGAAGATPAAASPAAPATSPAGEARGVVVVASGDAIDAAWALASVVYRDPVLRPKGLRDEPARVLAGEAPGPGAAAPLRELAELRSSVRGDDAPSRSVLTTLAQRAGASLVLVVFAPPGGPASARPFDPRAGRFEGWSLVPDALAPPASRWASAPGELRRRYEPPATAAKAPARPAPKAPPPAEPPRRWYSSPWLWGALGAAAAAAAIVVLATRGGNDDPTSNPPINIRVDR